LYIEFSPFLNKEYLYKQNHLKLALQKNGYDKKDMIKINKHANKTTISDTQPDKKIVSILLHELFILLKEQQIGRILNTIPELSSNPKR